MLVQEAAGNCGDLPEQRRMLVSEHQQRVVDGRRMAISSDDDAKQFS
jgi:hypothetical protein